MVCTENVMTYTSYNIHHENYDELIDAGFNHFQVDELSREVININLSTVMVDKKALDSNKILFDEKENDAEDTLFILELIKLEYPFGIREALVMQNGNKDRTQNLIFLINYLNKKSKMEIDPVAINNIAAELYNTVENRSTYEETDKRKKVLKRYEYYLTNEFKCVNKARNVQNKLKGKEPFDPYDYTFEELSHGKLVSLYKKIGKIYKLGR